VANQVGGGGRVGGVWMDRRMGGGRMGGVWVDEEGWREGEWSVGGGGRVDGVWVEEGGWMECGWRREGRWSVG